MAQQVDSLDIRINADATKASQSIAKLTQNVSNLSSALKSAETTNITPDTSGFDKVKARYERMVSAFEGFNRQLDELETKLASMGKSGKGSAGDGLREQIEDVKANIEGYSKILDEMESKHPELLPHVDTTSVEQASGAVEDLADKEGELADDGHQAEASQRSLGESLMSALATFKKVGIAVGQATSHLFRFISALNGAGKSSNKAGLSFGKMGKFLLRYVLGVRSLFFLMRRLRRGIVEGFGNLSQYSNEANVAINSLKASLLYLKNAFASGFAGLLAPISNFLQGVIDVVASALNAIGRFIATLGGKGFAVQAIKVSASSMEDLSKNTGSATGNAKKLNKALSVLPFDELNQLQGDKNSSGSGGGGGGGGGNALSASQMFETVALDGDEYIQQLGQRIRDAFMSKDWQELGKVLADPINKGIDSLYEKLDWNKNKSKIKAFTDGVTTTFNSLIKNVDWGKLGSTIASGINDITTAITGLVDGTDWRSLGSSLGTAFNNLLKNTNWADLGKTLTSKIKILIETASGFIDETNWESVGTAIGNFFIGALENINLPRLGQVLGDLINGAFRALAGMIETGALGTFVSDFTEGIANLFASIDFQLVGETIGDALASINWGEALGNLAKAFWDAFTGLISGLASSGEGGLIALALGGGILGGKMLGGLLVKGGGSVVGGLAHVLGSAIMAHPVVSAITFVLGGAILASIFNGGSEGFVSRTDFSEYGLSEDELQALEYLGYSRAVIASELKKGKGVDYYKKLAQNWQGKRSDWKKSAWGVMFGQYEEASKAIERSGAMPRASQVVMEEVARVTGKGGEKAITSFTDSANRQGMQSKLTTAMDTILKAFDISAKVKTKGANATMAWFSGADSKSAEVQNDLTTLTDKFANKYNKDSKIKGYGASGTASWFNGANEKYQSTVSSSLNKLVSNIVGKFSKDSTIKGYGASGAKAYVDGVNGYNVSSNAFATMFSNVKNNMLSDATKKIFVDAGKTLGDWLYGGISSKKFSMNIPDVDWSTQRGKQIRWGIDVLPNARGGVYDSATIIGYGVGEAGREAILPLENKRTMGMIANSILGGYGSSGIADQIISGVSQAILNGSRSQQINVNATLYTEDNEVLARAVNRGNRSIAYRENSFAYSGM